MSFLKNLFTHKSVLESPTLKGLGRGSLSAAKWGAKGVWKGVKTAALGSNLSRAALGGVAGGIWGAVTDDSVNSAHSDDSILRGIATGAALGGFGKSILKGGVASAIGIAGHTGKEAIRGIRNPTFVKNLAAGTMNNAGLILAGGATIGGIGYGIHRHEAYDSSLDDATLNAPINQLAAQQTDTFAGGTLVSTQPKVRNRSFESSTSGLVQALNNRRHG